MPRFLSVLFIFLFSILILYVRNIVKIGWSFKKYFRIPYQVSEIDVNIENGILKVIFHQDIKNETKINFK